MKTVGHRRYVAALLPMKRDLTIDEQGYRSFIRHFVNDPDFVKEGGLCVNPEAAEIFYLTRAEKRRVLEISMEEAHGKLPIIAGTWAITTAETVETAKDCKALGVDGIFVTPPGGAQDVTSCWDADAYPEIWLDQIIAQDRAVDLPIVTHPVGGAKPPFYPGLPLAATLRICKEVPNVVGWKMTYTYEGFRLIAKGLRGLDRDVAVMGALASRFHEYRLTNMFDGTLSGFWNRQGADARSSRRLGPPRPRRRVQDLGRRPQRIAGICRRHGPPAHSLQDRDLAARPDPEPLHAPADAQADAVRGRHDLSFAEEPEPQRHRSKETKLDH